MKRRIKTIGKRAIRTCRDLASHELSQTVVFSIAAVLCLFVALFAGVLLLAACVVEGLMPSRKTKAAKQPWEAGEAP